MKLKYIASIYLAILCAYSPMKAADDGTNYIINAFGNYIDNMTQNCDFRRDLSLELISQLSGAAKASCSVLRSEINKAASYITPYETQIRCEDNKAMPWAVCEANLKLCRIKLTQIKSFVEDCRYKIKIDTNQALKYKKN